MTYSSSTKASSKRKIKLNKILETEEFYLQFSNLPERVDVAVKSHRLSGNDGYIALIYDTGIVAIDYRPCIPQVLGEQLRLKRTLDSHNLPYHRNMSEGEAGQIARKTGCQLIEIARDLETEDKISRRRR